MGFRFKRIGAQSLLEVMDAVAATGPAEHDDIAGYSGLSKTTVVNALLDLTVLGLVKRHGSTAYASVGPYSAEWGANAKARFVHEAATSQPLVISYDKEMEREQEATVARRRSLAANGCARADETALESLLYLRDRLADAEDNLHSTGTSDPRSTATSPTTDDGVRRLMDDIARQLRPDEYSLLCAAFEKAEAMPDQSFLCAGKAVETLLRRVCVEAGEDATDLHGIGQLAEYMASKKRLILHPSHREMLRATGALRNIAGHGTDSVALQTWDCSPETALSNAVFATRVIRSILYWVSQRVLKA